MRLEAEDATQDTLSYRLLKQPISISDPKPRTAPIAGMLSGEYEVSVSCRVIGRGATASGKLALLQTGKRVGEVDVAGSEVQLLRFSVNLPTARSSLGLQFISGDDSSLRIEQIELTRKQRFIYRNSLDRHGLPMGRHIDSYNSLDLDINVPADAFGLLVCARMEPNSPKPPVLSVFAGEKGLGERTILFQRWTEYSFGLEAFRGSRVRLSLRISNPNGAAVIDYIEVLRRSRPKAYLLSTMGSFLEAAGASRSAAQCYLLSLRFYPENWRSKNNLLLSLLEEGLRDEAGVLLKLFDRFQPEFPGPGVRGDDILRIASWLDEQGMRERAMVLIDRYFRTYNHAAAAQILADYRAGPDRPRTIDISQSDWTLIGASGLSVSMAPELIDGRENAVIGEVITCRREANRLRRESQEVHLIDRIYDVPSGLLSPDNVLSDPNNSNCLKSGFEIEKGKGIVWGTGEESAISAEITKKNDILLTLKVRPRFVYNLLPRMDIFFNGTHIRELVLLPGWHEYQAFVPAEIQQLGQNILSLRYKYFGDDVRGEGGDSGRKVAFHYIEWWPTDERFKHKHIYETGTMVGNHRFELDGDVRQTLFVHPPRAVVYDIVVRDDTTLSCGLAISEKIWDRNCDGALFEILLYPKNKLGGENEPITLLSRFLDPCRNPEERHWFDQNLALSEYAGTVGKLVFQTTPGEAGDFWYDWAGFSDPTIRETVQFIDLSHKSLDANISCTGGAYKIAVVARGGPINLKPPVIGVLIDGQFATTIRLRSPEWATYWFKAPLDGGQNDITLFFQNETELSESWEPMRLLISDVGFLRIGG